MPVFQLDESISFPPPQMAREDGLLAVGGDLSPERLLLAYHLGIFPWYSPGEPILWWSPDPRLVLYPAELKVSRSLKKVFKQDIFAVTLDRAFRDKSLLKCVQFTCRPEALHRRDLAALSGSNRHPA